ncbi:hypothetical protein J6590_035719 [Homalodisca vitripennis]|nr:hypothetical protein J6590_035719 [Homalodisca vitripennis]
MEKAVTVQHSPCPCRHARSTHTNGQTDRRSDSNLATTTNTPHLYAPSPGVPTRCHNPSTSAPAHGLVLQVLAEITMPPSSGPRHLILTTNYLHLQRV